MAPVPTNDKIQDTAHSFEAASLKSDTKNVDRIVTEEKGIYEYEPLDQDLAAQIRKKRRERKLPAGNSGRRGSWPLPAPRSSPADSNWALGATKFHGKGTGRERGE